MWLCQAGRVSLSLSRPSPPAASHQVRALKGIRRRAAPAPHPQSRRQGGTGRSRNIGTVCPRKRLRTSQTRARIKPVGLKKKTPVLPLRLPAKRVQFRPSKRRHLEGKTICATNTTWRRPPRTIELVLPMARTTSAACNDGSLGGRPLERERERRGGGFKSSPRVRSSPPCPAVTPGWKMASRAGPRATGSDGSDFRHRERVAEHFQMR